jgi:hypothetical protein
VSRPAALPLAVTALVLVAGCIGGVPVGLDGTETSTPTTATPTDEATTRPTPTPTPEPTPETLDSQSYPWKPQPLRAGNVEVYVREYERTVRHNELVGPSVVDVRLSCRATLVAQVDAAYFVRAECDGSVHQRDDDGATSVGAVAPEQVTYFVDDPTVTRIAGAVRTLDPYRAEDGGLNVAIPEGVAVVNADDQRHDLRLVVRYDGNGTDDAVLDEAVAVAPGEGLDLRRVAAREGAYNLTVEKGNETVAQYRWQVDIGDTPRPGGVAVVVTPGGEVVVVALPEMR